STGCGCSATGNLSTNVAPWPASDSTERLPPFASVKPRAIPSPRPAPGRAGLVPRWNGSDVWTRSAGPAARAPGASRLPRPDRHPHPLLRGAALKCTLGQDHERPLRLVGVHEQRRGVVGDDHPDRLRRRAELLERAGADLVARDEVTIRLGGAGLEAGEIEQVP